MPVLNVKVAALESEELTRQISEMLLELTSRILHKKPGVTAVRIDYVSPERWSVGGVPLSELGASSFYFDIKITDETNTKSEKEQYIREAFTGFQRLLGKLHDVSYIHVHDVRAASYGYAGLTQEYRHHH